MDRFGVPNKVNRHVAKALKTIYKRKGSQEEQSVVFSEIFDEVEQSMRNLKPVTNLRSCVRRSLKNLENVFNNKTSKSTIAPNKSQPFRTMFPTVKQNDEAPRGLKAKRKLSNDSISDEELLSRLKRFKATKTLSKEAHPLRLPKHRVSNDNRFDCIHDDVPHEDNFHHCHNSLAGNVKRTPTQILCPPLSTVTVSDPCTNLRSNKREFNIHIDRSYENIM